jgi:ABC-type lipoprotein export system ATPase subunit
MPLVELRNISKIYHLGGEEIRALDDVSLDIEAGEFLSIIGPSGSGKSTLMHVLGCLDSPTKGTIRRLPRSRPAALRSATARSHETWTPNSRESATYLNSS